MSIVHFTKTGHGPALIFLHNGGGFSGIWQKQIDYLSNQFTCYALDLKGFGESPDPEGEPSLTLHEKSLQDFIDDQKIEEYHLVGNCIGASISLFHTLKNPKRVKSLILFNICPGIRIYSTPVGRFLHQNVLLAAPLKEFIGKRIIGAMGGTREKKRLPGLLFGKDPDINSELFLKYKALYRTEKQKKARLSLLHNIETFTTDHFFKNDVPLPPTLLFWGDHNKIVDLKEGYRLRDIIKPEEFCTLKDAGHMAMYENANEVNSKMESFLAEHIS